LFGRVSPIAYGNWSAVPLVDQIAGENVAFLSGRTLEGCVGDCEFTDCQIILLDAGLNERLGRSPSDHDLGRNSRINRANAVRLAGAIA